MSIARKMFKLSMLFLMLQKSRALQVQGAKGEAVVVYRKPLTTQDMQYYRLSGMVNNRVSFS